MTYNNIIDMKYNAKSESYGMSQGGLAGIISNGEDRLHSFATKMHNAGITAKKDIMRAGKKAGFTLIELLVVIGAIGLLAGIGVPLAGKAKEKANRVSCISNLMNISVAMGMYAEDNHGYMPGTGAGVNTATPKIRGPPGNYLGLGCLYEKYLGDIKIFGCRGSNKAKPQDVQNAFDGTGNVWGDYIYRATSGGTELIYSSKINMGKVMVMSYNCASQNRYDHNGKWVSLLHYDGSMGGVDNSDGKLTAAGPGEPDYSNIFLEAEKK